MELLHHARKRFLNEFLPAEVNNCSHNKDNQDCRDSMDRKAGRVQIARIMKNVMPKIGTKQITIVDQVNPESIRSDLIDQ